VGPPGRKSGSLDSEAVAFCSLAPHPEPVSLFVTLYGLARPVLSSVCSYSALTPDDVLTSVPFTAAGTTSQQNRLPSPAAVGERFL
jgi:hypothetical protein